MSKRDFDSIKKYIDYFSELIEFERREEKERHRKEIKEFHAKEREQKGRAILGLKFNEEKKGLGGKFVLKFSRDYPFFDNEISVGDLVMISRNEPLNPDNPAGTVTDLTNYSISVSFNKKPPGFVYSDGLRIDLYVNDITFQRMLDSLEEIKKDDLKKIRDLVLGESRLSFSPDLKIEYFNKELNSSQKEAVKNSVRSEDVFLIHGPPGTGKTTTLVEVIEQHIDRNKKVLSVAESNVAVDNLVEFLVKRGRNVVRVGHPARVSENLKKHTLDYLVEDTSEYKEAQKLWDEVTELNNKQDEFTYPSGRWRRGLSDDAIMDLAKKGKSSRGVPSEKIESMANWLRYESKIDKKVDKAKELEDKAVESVLEEAEVILTTNSTSGSDLLKNKTFDVVVIDEATQSTEPSCLIPITKAKKVVMAGDHHQLPPTILNEEAKKRGLDVSLFERILDIYSEDIKNLLNVQYRMNEKIMGFSNKEFYGSDLCASDSVKNHDINDLVNKNKFKSGSEALVFYDTLGNFLEEKREGSTSKQNEGESKLVKELLETAIDSGLSETDLGVISPYDDQINLLKQKIDREGLEIKTVDGFQGREKEVIILSLVRSNEDNKIGFLKDYRRLNVSLTRAKRKLIIIGDSNTLCSNNIYKRLFDYFKQNGLIYSLA